MILPLIDENGNVVHLPTDEICCIEKDPKTRKILIHTVDARYRMPSTVEEIQDALSIYGYIQIDRHKLVNLKKVDRYEYGKLYIGLHAMEVAKRRREVVEAALIENRSRNAKKS